jgi:hypothetical protein
MPKIHTFQLVWKNCFLDNTADIRYLNPGNQLPRYDRCVISEIRDEI